MKLSILIISILLVGCSAPTKELKIVENNCLNKMKGNPVFCSCMVEKIEQDLTNIEVEFLAAGFEKDLKKISEIRDSMEQQDVDHLGDFMTKSVKACSVKNKKPQN